MMYENAHYTSDVTDAQWGLIDPHIPDYPGERPRKTDTRDVVDALLYILRTGCHRRYLPKDFPPTSTVWRYFGENQPTRQPYGSWPGIVRSTCSGGFFPFGEFNACPSPARPWPPNGAMIPPSPSSTLPPVSWTTWEPSWPR